MKSGKLIIIALIVALIAAFFAFDLGRYLSLAFIKSKQAELTGYYAANQLQTIAGFFVAYVVVTLIAGIFFPRLEYHFLPDLVSRMSAPAAMAICSSISSGMIALTGIVFSLAFVMVQFSATAYSPRLVLWVASPTCWT